MHESESCLETDQQIVAALRRIIRAVDLHSRRLVEAHGLTGPQLATLHEAARGGPLSAGVLARRVHLSPPTVTGILTRLEKRGLVERRPSETDRRSVAVHVTPAGQALLTAAPSLLQDQFRRLLAGLEGWEQQMILATLDRIAGMMGADAIDASPHLVSGSMGFQGESDAPAAREIHDSDSDRHQATAEGLTPAPR